MMTTWHEAFATLDWKAVAAVVALIGVFVSLYSLRRQMKQQNMLAVKKIEQDYLEQLLRSSDRVYRTILLDVERLERAREAGQILDTASMVHNLEFMLMDYRHTVLLSLHVIREIRVRRFPRGVTDEPMNQMENFAREVLERYEKFCRELVKIADVVDVWDLGALDLNVLSGSDFMLRVPISEMIARIYVPGRREWKPAFPR